MPRNRWRIKRRIASLSALCVCAISAPGQEPATDRPAQRFHELDANHDGRLALDEMLSVFNAEQAPLAKRDFRAFDADRDGTLMLAEFRCLPMLVAEGERGPYPDPQIDHVTEAIAAVERQWADWDGDQTGSLSAAEFDKSTLTDVVPILRDTRFVEWDRNSDGIVTRADCRLVFEIAWGVREPQGQLVRRPDGRCVAWMGFKLIDRDNSRSLTLEECRMYGYDGERAEEIFRQSDKDDNGQVTYAEWAAMPMRNIGAVGEFLRLDADMDGQVSRQELETGAHDWQRQLAAYVFPGFDNNGDGQLTYTEYTGCPLSNLQQLWHNARNDTNHNGVLEFAEFDWNQGFDAIALQADFFARLDLNHDHVLNIDEFFFDSDAIPPIQRFRRWDDDADGALNEAEFVAHVGPPREIAQRDFHLVDFNHDNVLSVAEFSTLPTTTAPRDRGVLPDDPIVNLAQQQLARIDAAWNLLDKGQSGRVSVGQFVSGARDLFAVPLQLLFPRTGVDRDSDGAVTHDEARAFVESAWGIRRNDGELLREPSGLVFNLMHFGHLDQNHDDRLTLDEFAAQTYLQGRVNEVFRQVDADGNQRITFREWKEMPGVGVVDTVQEFRHLDADLDGKVSPAELRERVPDWKKQFAARIFPAFDLNGDGTLSLSEYRFCPVGNPIVKWHEQIIDPDDDGILTFAEFNWPGAEEFPVLRWEYFTRFDKDHSGGLTNSEFVFRTRVPDAFYILNADGTGWRKLFDVPGHQQCGSPAVSPDGRTIAFDACRVKTVRQAGGPYRIFVAGIDGAQPHALCEGNMPTWSPDGRYFACSRAIRSGHGVWLMNADGTEDRFICNAWGVQWSPDGSRLAYYEGTRLMVYELGTEKTHEVLGSETNPYRQIYWNLTWSPDGTRICFKGRRQNDVDEVATVSASGAELGFTVHQRGGTINADFAWHPDENRVVFSMLNPDRGRVQLYEFNPDSGDAPVLMAGQDPELNNTDACWTPDGRQLIVVSGDF